MSMEELDLLTGFARSAAETQRFFLVYAAQYAFSLLFLKNQIHTLLNSIRDQNKFFWFMDLSEITVPIA